MDEVHLPDKLLSRICRACMSKETSEDIQTLQSIYQFPPEYDTLRIVDLLIRATPQLAIDATDELPKEICAECLSQLLSVHKFQQMCLNSDTHLRSLLGLNEIENKFTEVADVLSEALTEDPLNSTTTVLSIDGELKTCLKLEEVLQEEDEEKDEHKESTLIKENIMEIVDDSAVDAVEMKENKIIVEKAIIAEDNDIDEHSDCRSIGGKSEEDSDADQVEEAEKKKNGKNKRKPDEARIEKHSEDEQNIVEPPNPKNRRSAILPCPECGKVFDRTYSLNRHMNVHKAIDKPYECTKCKYRFSTKAHLKRHELSHQAEVQKCQNADLITEPSTTNPEGYKCSDCPRRFAKRESLSAHRTSHSKLDDGAKDESRTYLCTLCPKKFKKLNQLTRHSRVHAENKHFKCHLCDKSFGLNAHLVDHLNKHNGVKPYVCNFCSKAFQQSCTLKDHIRTHTGEQPYLCSECGKAFNSSSNMKQHLLRHTGEKRYECPECPKKFPCLSDLGSHMAVHNKVKPHVCDICGSAFGKPYQLKKHKMYHNGEKPHKCEYCEMRFVCADHMRRHMRTHTGEKPYKCKYCERAFAQSNDLVKHLRSHVGENVYKCELCPQAFRLATELREHFAQHKNDDEETRAKNALALLNEEASLRQRSKITEPSTEDNLSTNILITQIVLN